MIRKVILLVFTTLSLILFGCSKSTIETEYTKSIKEWQNNRVERLKKSIWLKLSGLYWLEEGANTFGSDKSNKIIFPEKAPAKIGLFIVKDGQVTIKVNDNINVLIDSAKISEKILISDMEQETTMLQLGSYTWYLIQREDKLGIRLYDDEHPALSNFEGIDTYEPDSTWRIEAEYIPYNPPKIVIMPSVIGTESADSCFGKIQFKRDGKTYSLDPVKSGDNFFIVFADATNGKETYGTGRFLYVEGPVIDGKIIIDFNKAYNPPCAFSKYATCPLPPKDNYLKLEVTAGEKNYGHH